MEEITEGEELERCIEKTMQEAPKDKGWMSKHLFQYQNVWLSSAGLRGVIMANQLFKPQPSDIICVTSPKAGTTWIKAIVFAIMTRTLYSFSDNPLLTKGPHDCVPFIETMFDKKNLLDLPSPRLLSSHIPCALLPVSVISSECKIVYVSRNPKDLLVSQWKFFSKVRDRDLPPLSLGEAFELFCEGCAHYGPYWDHVLGYSKMSLSSPEKVLFLQYEDMKMEPVREVKRLARFLGRPFSSEEEEQGRVQEVIELCSFEKLSNLEVNKNGVHRFSSRFEVGNQDFFRKGVVGDWRNHLTEAMGQQLDQITQKRFSGSGFKLSHH